MKLHLIPETEQECKDYGDGTLYEGIEIFILGLCTSKVPLPGNVVLNNTFFHGPSIHIMHGLAELQLTYIKETK